jgi:hypothetical protein
MTAKPITQQPSQQKPPPSPIVVYGGLVIAGCVLICIGGCCIGIFSPRADKPDDVGAYVFAQNAVTQALKCPSTAQFPSGVSEFVSDQGGGVFTVRAYVDAQNSFGAMVRTRFTARVKYLGNHRWQLEDLQLGN